MIKDFVKKNVGAVGGRNFPSPIVKAHRLYNSMLLPQKPWYLKLLTILIIIMCHLPRLQLGVPSFSMWPCRYTVFFNSWSLQLHYLSKY